MDTRDPVPPELTLQPVAFCASTGLAHELLGESVEPVAAVAGIAATTTPTDAARSTPADFSNAFTVDDFE
jgi:hypothetical protein